MTTPLTELNQGINKGVLNPEVVEILEKVKRLADDAVNTGLFIAPGGRRSYFNFVKPDGKIVKGFHGMVACNRFILDNHINDDEYLKLHESNLLTWSYNGKTGTRDKEAYFFSLCDAENVYTNIIKSHKFLSG